MAENLLGMSKQQKIYVYENIFGPEVGCLSFPGPIYMYMTIIFKQLLLRNRLANQSQTLGVNASFYK